MTKEEMRLHRRVSGWHDLRLDGIGDLLFRASGASVLDLGCNRGMAGLEFAANGARLVHGVDIYEDGVAVANYVAGHLFADSRNVESRFEVLDMTKGVGAFDALFGTGSYDIVLALAIFHKLERIMPRDAWSNMVVGYARKANRYLAWRGARQELDLLEPLFERAGLKRIQYSEISESISPAGIWGRRP